MALPFLGHNRTTALMNATLRTLGLSSESITIIVVLMSRTRAISISRFGTDRIRDNGKTDLAHGHTWS